MITAWKKISKDLSPWPLKEDYSNFESLVLKLTNLSKGVGVPKGMVSNTTYWLQDDCTNRILGAVNIRHSLNSFFMKSFGNIGYGIRPDERNKGYGFLTLKLSLNECKKIGLSRVLLGCYKDNIASSRIIIKNGGKLESEFIEPETHKVIQKYWIEL